MNVGRSLCIAAAVAFVAGSAFAAAERPLTVSPGSTDSVETAAANCPTFSWSGVARARAYEIAVYELARPGAVASAGERPALTATVPGGALSWTPPADRCLGSSAAYVWFVRALGRGGNAGDWSEGGMFRTREPSATADLKEEIARWVERYLAESPPPTASVGVEPAPTASSAAPAKTSGLGSPGRSVIDRAGSSEIVAFTAADGATTGDTTIGVMGTSHSNENESSGVVGISTASAGDVTGVTGIAESSEGKGVMGLNTAASGGVGVLGEDEAASGLTAGVAGITQNPDGYGGFFWSDASTGDPLALVVAEPVGDPPTTATVKFSVNKDGDVALEGVVAFTPTDTPPGCDSSVEGTIYYDDSEDWLCVCTVTGAGPVYGWRRADDPTDDCSI